MFDRVRYRIAAELLHGYTDRGSWAAGQLDTWESHRSPETAARAEEALAILTPVERRAVRDSFAEEFGYDPLLILMDLRLRNRWPHRLFR